MFSRNSRAARAPVCLVSAADICPVLSVFLCFELEDIQTLTVRRLLTWILQLQLIPVTLTMEVVQCCPPGIMLPRLPFYLRQRGRILTQRVSPALFSTVHAKVLIYFDVVSKSTNITFKLFFTSEIYPLPRENEGLHLFTMYVCNKCIFSSSFFIEKLFSKKNKRTEVLLNQKY